MLSAKLADNRLFYGIEVKKINALLSRRIQEQNYRKPLYCASNRKLLRPTESLESITSKKPVEVYGRIHPLAGRYYYLTITLIPEGKRRLDL